MTAVSRYDSFLSCDVSSLSFWLAQNLSVSKKDSRQAGMTYNLALPINFLVSIKSSIKRHL